MTNAEKFKEVFGSDLEESRMLSMPSSFNQIIALKSFQIEGVDCADEWKESEYQGEPTIPLSVIEDVKAEIEEQIDRYDDRNISEYEDCLAIIDRKIAKIKGDKPFRYAKEIIEAQSPPSEGVNGEEFEKWLREGDKE